MKEDRLTYEELRAQGKFVRQALTERYFNELGFIKLLATSSTRGRCAVCLVFRTEEEKEMFQIANNQERLNFEKDAKQKFLVVKKCALADLDIIFEYDSEENVINNYKGDYDLWRM